MLTSSLVGGMGGSHDAVLIDHDAVHSVEVFANFVMAKLSSADV